MNKKLRLLFVCLTISLWAWPQPVEAFGEGCAVYRTSAYSVSSGSWTAIPFNAERWDDTLQCHAASATTMSVAEGYSGWYMICGGVVWNASVSNALGIRLNGATFLTYATTSSDNNLSCAVYRLSEGDYVELMVLQNSGGSRFVQVYGAYSPEFRMVRVGPGSHPAFNSIQNLPGVASTPQPPQAHASNHQDGGSDEINVAGLSGILTDTQDAGWLQGLSITITEPTDGQVLAWNAANSEWQPQEVSATIGGFTMPEVITTVISGTVPVVITSTYQYTQMLSSGHDIAVIRSFTFGEASIAIGLLIVAALLGLNLLFELLK